MANASTVLYCMYTNSHFLYNIPSVVSLISSLLLLLPLFLMIPVDYDDTKYLSVCDWWWLIGNIILRVNYYYYFINIDYSSLRIVSIYYIIIFHYFFIFSISFFFVSCRHGLCNASTGNTKFRKTVIVELWKFDKTVSAYYHH